MVFKIGNKIRAGTIHSDETKEKIRKKAIGRTNSEETREKIRKHHLGKKRTEATRKAISKANMGHVVSQETRKKLSEAHQGEKNRLWKGGITPMSGKIRNSLEYRLWREAVFKRDNYTCIWCGDNRGGNLNADHIKPFAYFPELRFAIDNGRTLCESCHRKTDT